ncbi:unnamed protein product [Rhizoctonia solani]|uniref:Heme haloperoxidase family profile domain-containing protein n=1 Tax=Rhizoctonia solani TaxID=456999 RepID=A0A8H2WCF4_9AGAM|nr:unnamed protein product [Rhizoctonia solani]
MRATSFAISLALVGASVAFPTSSGAGAAGYPFTDSPSKRQTTDFDSVNQKIDVSGEHEFRPPQSEDKRGPCPALNAMANHGYINRNGLTNLYEATSASNKVYGLGNDAAAAFAIMGVIYGGDPSTGDFSIGMDPKPGLSGTHNKMEGDASPTRNDAHVNNGDASTLDLNYFKRLYNSVPGMESAEGESAHFDMNTMAVHRDWTRNQSIAVNPHYFTYSSFFSGPIQVVFVSTLAHLLLPQLVANHSVEHPGGILNHNGLKDFYSVTGSGTSLSYTPGHERISENWYRRRDDYTIANVLQDFAKIIPKYPQFLSIGGNTGKANSFAGIDPGNLTDGVYNARNLLEGNNMMCFV